MFSCTQIGIYWGQVTALIHVVTIFAVLQQQQPWNIFYLVGPRNSKRRSGSGTEAHSATYLGATTAQHQVRGGDVRRCNSRRHLNRGSAVSVANSHMQTRCSHVAKKTVIKRQRYLHWWAELHSELWARSVSIGTNSDLWQIETWTAPDFPAEKFASNVSNSERPMPCENMCPLNQTTDSIESRQRAHTQTHINTHTSVRHDT